MASAQFDTLDTLSLRVGALPLYPTNALKYNLTWSTDGLINEYCNPCTALVDGELRQLAPLEDLEELPSTASITSVSTPPAGSARWPRR